MAKSLKTQPLDWQGNVGPYDGAINAAAARWPSLYLGGSYGLLSSTDAGAHWNFQPMSHSSVQSITLLGDTLVVCSTGGGVQLSTDKGLSWSSRNVGMGSLVAWTFTAVGSQWYCGSSGGVYTSSNHGLQWQADTAGCGVTTVNAILQLDSILILGTTTGIYRRGVSGQWQKSDSGFSTPVIKCLAAQNHVLYLGGNGGVYVSTDAGLSWTQRGIELASMSVRALQSNSNFLYATTNHGVWKSSNGGLSWLAIPLSTTDSNCTALAVEGSNCIAGTIANGAFVSSNGGTSWVHLNAAASVCRAILSTANVSYCSSFNGVWLSTDQGLTWNLSSLNGRSVIAFAASKGTVFAATPSNGVFRSLDNGLQWTQNNAGLADTSVRSMVADSLGAIVGTRSGVYLSTNDGASWEKRNTGIETLTISALTRYGYTIVAGTSTMGVYRSTDNGISWEHSDLSGADSSVLSVVHDGSVYVMSTTARMYRSVDGLHWLSVPFTPKGSIARSLHAANGVLYLAVDSAGVWQSSDHGQTWSSCGLADQSIYALTHDTSFVYAASNGGGVFRARRDGSADVLYSSAVQTRPDVSVYQRSSTLVVESRRREFDVVELYDVVGHLLVTQRCEPRYSTEIDLGVLTPGSYIVRVLMHSSVLSCITLAIE